MRKRVGTEKKEEGKKRRGKEKGGGRGERDRDIEKETAMTSLR